MGFPVPTDFQLKALALLGGAAASVGAAFVYPHGWPAGLIVAGVLTMRHAGGIQAERRQAREKARVAAEAQERAKAATQRPPQPPRRGACAAPLAAAADDAPAPGPAPARS